MTTHHQSNQPNTQETAMTATHHEDLGYGMADQ